RPDHALKVQWFKRGSNGRRELIIPSVISQSKLNGEQLQFYNQPTYKFDSSGLNRTLIISNILPDIIPSDYHYKLTQKSVYSEEYTCHAYLNGYNSNNVFEMNDFLVGDSEFISSPSSSSSLLSSAFSLYRSVSPISTTARLKLYLPPKIHFPPNIDVNSSTIQLEFIPRPSKLIVIETSASMDIQLPCELDRVGIPAAEIKWLRNGDSINIINKDRNKNSNTERNKITE
uniref:Ig-like domain-containing protein n=1 Tax=Trichobilharzia regenti TaxID=157069 RepID=A0AA85J3K2_TRIRE